MFYLNMFLFIFSLRFGCRLIAYIEICCYSYAVYLLADKYGFTQLLQSMMIICLATSCVLSFLMLVSTLQSHESSGIIFTYLMWGIFTTIFVVIFYVMTFLEGKIPSTAVFATVLVCLIIIKPYFMLVVLSFMHQLISSDSEDSL